VEWQINTRWTLVLEKLGGQNLEVVCFFVISLFLNFPHSISAANINNDKHANYLFIMSEDASRTASISATSIQEEPAANPTTTATAFEDHQNQEDEEEPQQQQQQLSTVTAVEEEEAQHVSSTTL